MCDSNCVVKVNDRELYRQPGGSMPALLRSTKLLQRSIYDSNMVGNYAYERRQRYATEVNELDITGCNINDNTALRGGGIFALESPKLDYQRLQNSANEAYRSVTYQTDPNDPNTLLQTTVLSAKAAVSMPLQV